MCSAKASITSFIKKSKREPYFRQTIIASVKSKTQEETLQQVEIFQKTLVDIEGGLSTKTFGRYAD